MDKNRKIIISLAILGLFLVMVGSVLAYTYTNTLLVDTVPTGAKIYAGGIYKGDSPLRITNLYDTETNNYHLITATKTGYKDAAEYVSTPAGSNNVVNITLESAYTFTNTLQVNTIPEGANVTVVGIIKGLNRMAYTLEELYQAFPEKSNVLLTNLADTNENSQYDYERKYFLQIKKEGYAPYNQFIETPAGSNNVINIVLNPEPQVRFIVTSEPAGAIVRTESAGNAGYTPIDVNKTVQDYTNYYTYRLILEKPGYFTSTTYHNLRAGDTKTVHVKLKEISSTGGFWLITNPTEASWKLTKTGHPGYQGITSSTAGAGGNSKVDLGIYTLTVTKKGYATHTSIVNINQPNTAQGTSWHSFNVNLAQTGTLNLGSSPSEASIYIDGINRGVTPATFNDLAPGKHELSLKKFGYLEYKQDFDILAGQITKITPTLIPK